MDKDISKIQEEMSPEDLFHFIEEIKRQWLMTVDAMVDPLMMINHDFEILKTNHALAELASVDVRTIVGQKCYEILAERKSPCEGCLLKKSLTTKQTQKFKLTRIRDKFDFEVASKPIFDSDGNIDGIVHVYRDQTEALALQRQLIQSEKLASIGLLAGGIAHEINNPLGGILIFSQMLLREVPAKSSFYQDIQEIERAALRCAEIVKQLLNFARAQPDNDKKKLRPIDGNLAAQSALRFASIHLYAKHSQVITNWNSDPLLVMSDENLLTQVFLNLLQNAFQAMPQGGTLSISSYREQKDQLDWAVWEISDTGPGIKPSHLEKIFDPFFTTKEPGEGTGLGLSICYGICQDLGGTIKVSSQQGEGTNFQIHLPLSN